MPGSIAWFSPGIAPAGSSGADLFWSPRPRVFLSEGWTPAKKKDEWVTWVTWVRLVVWRFF